MKSSSGASWFLVVLILIGMMVLVMAATGPDLVGYDVNYTAVEEEVYYHNFSANVTGFNGDVDFEIDTTTDINWTNATGIYSVVASVVSDWILMADSSTGNLTISAAYDNQTGFFAIPIQTRNTTNGGLATTATYNFIVNATNDYPNFTSAGIVSSYVFNSDESVQNFTLTAEDEEEHFPLIFDVSFNSTNCTHGVGTGYADNSNCNLSAFGMSLTHTSNETAVMSFAPNASYVGTYWANVSVTDASVDYDCPHNYCEAGYNSSNLTRYYSEMIQFTVSPSLNIDASNCTGGSLVENEEFNCTIVITTPGEVDNLNISSDADFRVDSSAPYNSSWFSSDDSVSASNFNYNVSISVNASKREVGNWTINFTADNGLIDPVSELIYVYVDYVESNVSLDSISDLNGSNSLYGNHSFLVNASDEDLLIADGTVKYEVLTFGSNTSWVNVTSLDTRNSGTAGNLLVNYITANVSVDHAAALLAEGLIGNYTVLINVSDSAGSVANRTFIVEIFNETAPEWSVGLGEPVNLSLTEDENFVYNVSANVTAEEGGSLTFYYVNVSAEFCSLNSTNFNSSTGMINFTPTDCDVGYHNVTIVASDGNLNSTVRQFNFSVANIADVPVIASTFPDIDGDSIDEGDNKTLNEGSQYTFNLIVDDDDFLIPSGQRDDFYNESLTIDVVVTNSTGSDVNLFEFSFVEYGPSDESVSYNASFTPSGSQIDNFTVMINITDSDSNSINRSFYLNVTSVNDLPNITSFGNFSKSIEDIFYVNVSEYTSDEEGEAITYGLYNLTSGGDFLTIDSSTGIINLTLNSTYVGVWEYNVTANDTASLPGIGSRIFRLTVHGTPNITTPLGSYVFNWTEGNSTGDLDFNVSYGVNGTDLTYLFYLDNIVYFNSTDYNYTNTTILSSDNLRNETNWTWASESNFSWNFTPNYSDETYGMLKNLTLMVYNPDYPELNNSVNWKVNVSHVNQNVSFRGGVAMPDKGPISYGSTTTINLSEYFEDADYWDETISQTVNFTITTVSGTGFIALSSSFDSNWILTLGSSAAVTEVLEVVAHEYDSDDNYIGNATSDRFSVEFVEPSVVTTPTSGGSGTTTKLKHYSLKLIVPQDIVISERNYIDIPFSVQNNGQIDLSGISLSSFVRFDNIFSDEVTISLEDDFIDELKFGQSENFSMRILANTGRAGKYKATIFANVTSPKFSDWADFFIEIRKANESEAEQILIFTEKLIADNPECLELTELINRAEEAFSLGEFSNAVKMAREAVEACENSIEAGGQIRFGVDGFVKDNFYYISFATLVIFFMGFVFYIYKRVRFNKSGMDEYV